MNPDTFSDTTPDRRAAWHFTVFRVIFGAYLAVHFATCCRGPESSSDNTDSSEIRR